MSETVKTHYANAPELASVARLVRALPAVCRKVFTLRKVYGYSGREIAIRLGIPDEAVEALLIQAARVCAQEDVPVVEGLAQTPSLPEEAQVAIR
ncbi:MAG: sigma factor-like helix-turn-helix DNA-binding protein [Gammaproteobacteria bacterium]